MLTKIAASYIPPVAYPNLSFNHSSVGCYFLLPEYFADVYWVIGDLK